MKIKRYVAKDMRTALEQIKTELGADAVIMSNKKIPEGVELMAAIDHSQPAATQQSPSTLTDQPDHVANREIQHDVVTLQSKVAPTQNNAALQVNQSATNESAANMPPADSLSALLNRQVQQQTVSPSNEQKIQQPASIEEQFKNFTDRLQSSTESTSINTQDKSTAPAEEVYSNNLATNVTARNNSKIPLGTAAAVSQSTVHESAEINRMRDEMASIRQLLEHQVAGLLWQDMAQKNPNKAVLVSRLENMGISTKLADQFAGYVSSTANEKKAWEEVKHLLVDQLNTTNNDIIRHGGVVSLVGPTGVGKTTTIAKLAARFAQAHGADSVVLISTDTYRIAGFEQLSTYARIIGCQAKLAKDQKELDELIQYYADKKLVLIDTAGMGQRDLRLSQYLTTLIANARVRIRNYLVLSANTQPRVMQENVERFKKIPLAGCIFTKLDESLSFGEIITTAIENGLAIGYLTDGQRVPEDIKVANAEKLVTLADKATQKYAQPQTGKWQTNLESSIACA